ncbi:MAG: hypothetical protein J1F14_02960 [Treponema sp.]|nr:hypothetical protein [Treponema sp.]
MAEEKELSPIEREIVLQYLRDDNVPVTVTLEEKPSATETDFLGDRTASPDNASRIPASAVFPVALPAEQLTVLNQGIILLKNAARTVQPFLGKTVRVQFYFNHVGLYFITTMKDCSAGLALVVPRSIKRMQETVTVPDYDVTARISYTSREGNVISLDCVPLAGCPIFFAPRWDEIELENQREAKGLLENYVAEARSGEGGSIGNGLHLLRVCYYLTQRTQAVNEAIQGLSKPLYLLFVDEQRLVLACDNGQDVLQLEEEYDVSFEFTIPANKLLKRVINASFVVDNVYSAPSGEKRCFSASFRGMKAEDFRYLSERIIKRA